MTKAAKGKPAKRTKAKKDKKANARDGADYVAANRKLWDARTPIHLASEYYDIESFKAGRDSLRPLEVAEVGDVAGRSLLHLQCHFGQDTIAWARRGATVTGIDFAPEAIASARQLAADCGVEARFIEADVYDLPNNLDERFDIVFTSYGVLAWLPDLRAWADVVARFVRPGGFFYIAEIHPTSQVLSDEADEPRIGYSYFDQDKPLRFHERGTYADPWADIKLDEYYWPHGLGEIVTALVDAGLVIEFLHEHDMTVYQQFGYLERGEDGWWHQPLGQPALPLLFSLKASRARI